MTKDRINDALTEVTDFEDPALDVYARMTEGELLRDPAKGLFIAESPKVILRALAGGYEPVSFLVERKQLKEEAREALALCPGVPVFVADYAVLRELTGFPMTRGVLCAMKRKPLPSVEEVCRDARRVAVMEKVMNPTNVGAIFRSAAALNMDAVLLTPGCSNPLYRRAIRVSMGTVFQIPWTQVSPDLRELKALGFKTAAMALEEDAVSIDEPALLKEEKLAVVLGAEGDGLSPVTIEDCDYTVMIPMSHGVDSLNVAAASAVAFWQLGRRPERE
ncbi:MAG: RNA methyltransferase [Firmicutes bacterium]|nr:RNA methyltransferase [Bacillota bacterium]